jgi:hypothetical protein
MIKAPNGQTLVTLRDAADYILSLPLNVAWQDQWQIALHCLIEAAEDRQPLLHARAAVLRALKAGKPNRDVTRRRRPRGYRTR